MKSFATLIAASGLLSAVQATYYGHEYVNVTAPVVYTTKTVSSYTTFCPYPTEIVQGGKTYTVTSATTLTITDCPCTITHPVPYPTGILPPVNGTVVVSTVTSTSTVVTYCPEPTTLTLTIGTITTVCPVTTPGTATIPVVITTVVPVTTLPPAATPTKGAPPVTTNTPIQVGSGGVPGGPQTTGPIEANGAVREGAGIAGIVVGIAAMFL